MFECGWGGWMVGWSEGLRAGLEVASTDGMSERETRARDRRDAGPWCESNDFTLQILALWIRQQRRGDCKKRQKVQLFRFSLRHLYSSLRVELPVLSETQQLYIMGQRDERTKVAEFTSKCNSIDLLQLETPLAKMLCFDPEDGYRIFVYAQLGILRRIRWTVNIWQRTLRDSANEHPG